MTAKTTAERQRSLRESRQQAGLKEVRNLWVSPVNEQAVRDFAAKLQRKREKAK